MNKVELRDAYVAKGYKVEPVARWIKVSQVETITKYDVNVADPKGSFYTAQVIVENDGEAGEDAKAAGRWEATPETFEESLDAYLRGAEKGKIFAIVKTQTYPSDQAALVKVYTEEADNTLTTKDYLVRYRASAFSFKPVA